MTSSIITGMREAEGGRQPAAAKPRLYQVLLCLDLRDTSGHFLLFGR